MKSIRHNEKGAAVIEFAVLLMLLLPLVFGIIEFGFIWAQSHYLSQAAREGARSGARIAIYDSGLNEIINQTQVAEAVATSVTACLETAPFYAGRADKIATISPPLLVFFGAVQPALQVNVTVNSAAIWPPMLWQLLTLIPSSDGQHSGVEELSDSAVFAISGQ